MSGVLFIVTIPTECHEWEQEQVLQANINRRSTETGVDSMSKAHCSNSDHSTPEQTNGTNSNGNEKSTSMECIITDILAKFQIENSVWLPTQNTNFYQITFAVESDVRHELILSMLNDWGIGYRNESSVTIVPCTIQTAKHDPMESETFQNQKETAWHCFINSIRARWNVAQIVQKVRQDATLTFDYVTLVLVAGTLASMGLVENNTTFLASSMLISPLMNPIIAIVFGIVIKDKSLIRFGMKNEIIGILIATTVGFLFGIIICFVDSKYEYGSDSEAALTTEMIGRCTFHSLVIGIFAALLSGAAVAIAILGGNIGSLVGVAISASLLPPAVNSGVLWSLAVLCFMHADDDTRYNRLVSTNIYSNNHTLELVAYGVVSLMLTLINIICILIFGVLILKIKEVAPITTRNQKQLWKYDIKIARNFNRTNNNTDGEEHLTRRLADEISDFENGEGVYNSSYINTWSPMTAQTEPTPSVSGLEKTIYSTPPQSWNQIMRLNQSKYRMPKPFPRLNDDSRRFSLPSPHTSDSIPRTNIHINQMNMPKIGYTSTTPNDGCKYIGIESLNHNENGQPLLKDISRKGSKKFIVTPTSLDKVQMG